MVLDGPMNAPWFQGDFQQVLAPTLKPGDVVIMDNLAAYKGAPGPGSFRGRRPTDAVRAALWPRDQPDRGRCRQAQGSAEEGCRQGPRTALGRIARIIQTYSPMHAPTTSPPRGMMQTVRKIL